MGYSDPAGPELDELLKEAERYSLATGLPCRVLDRDGRCIGRNIPAGPAPDAAGGCRLCAIVRTGTGDTVQDCSGVHRYGSRQAERFGGIYIYFCPNTLVHWAAPVSRDGEPVATLLGGPALMIEPAEFLAEEILSRFTVPDHAVPAVRAAVREIPYVTPARISALSELLKNSAAAVSARLSPENTDRHAATEHQSRIRESIQELKVRYEAPNVAAQAAVPAYPVEKEKALMEMIRKGDRIGAQTILNGILGYIFFSSGRDLQTIRIRVLELIVLLSRAAVEGGASVEEVFGLNDRSLPRLQRLESVDDIAAWLSTLLRRFSDCVFVLKEVKHADLIRKTVRFIRTRYAERLTLETVSAEAALSPSYFSRVFKDEIGMSFVEYLSRVRIERSKVLLRDRRIPLVEVAAMAGFTDQSYFTKVFRRLTGVSPGRFRESGGRLPEPAETLRAAGNGSAAP